jgi:hypothetical protein
MMKKSASMAHMFKTKMVEARSNLGQVYLDRDPALPFERFAVEQHQRDVPLHEANRSHDDAHGDPYKWARIRSGWISEMLMRGDLLTDKRIDQLTALGRYDDAYKEMLRALVKTKSDKMRLELDVK